MIRKKTVLARIFAGLFLLAFLLITGLLIYGALQPEVLPLGAPLPEMRFRAESGEHILQPDSTCMTLVMYFHTECKYCRAQLRTFDENTETLKMVRLILLTYEKDLFEKRMLQALTELAQMSDVVWGIADQNALFEHFAPRTTPTRYIFDRTGTLVSKISGEAKLDMILNEFKRKWWSGTPF